MVWDMNYCFIMQFVLYSRRKACFVLFRDFKIVFFFFYSVLKSEIHDNILGGKSPFLNKKKRNLNIIVDSFIQYIIFLR